MDSLKKIQNKKNSKVKIITHDVTTTILLYDALANRSGLYQIKSARMHHMSQPMMLNVEEHDELLYVFLCDVLTTSGKGNCFFCLILSYLFFSPCNVMFLLLLLFHKR